MTMTDTRTWKLDRWTEFMTAGSPTVAAAVHQHGEWMPQAHAERVVSRHGVQWEDVESDLLGVCAVDAGRVHTAYLFVALGY